MKSKFLIPLALFLGINANAQRFTDNDVEKVCQQLQYTYAGYYGENTNNTICMGYRHRPSREHISTVLSTFTKQFGTPKTEWKGKGKVSYWKSQNYILEVMTMSDNNYSLLVVQIR